MATLVPELCGAGGAEIQLADAAEAKSFLEIVSEPKKFPYNYIYIHIWTQTMPKHFCKIFHLFSLSTSTSMTVVYQMF